jgi:hypothetical protein
MNVRATSTGFFMVFGINLGSSVSSGTASIIRDRCEPYPYHSCRPARAEGGGLSYRLPPKIMYPGPFAAGLRV